MGNWDAPKKGSGKARKPAELRKATVVKKSIFGTDKSVNPRTGKPKKGK
jgi:hypothetical protein